MQLTCLAKFFFIGKVYVQNKHKEKQNKTVENITGIDSKPVGSLDAIEFIVFLKSFNTNMTLEADYMKKFILLCQDEKSLLYMEVS